MSLDLEFDDAQGAISTAVEQLCQKRCTPEAIQASEGKLPAELWQSLADMGVLGIANEEDGAGAIEAVAATEVLGRFVFPGPLVETLFATRVLSDPVREEIASGAALVSVGCPPLLPWAPLARHFIELEGERAWLAKPRGEIEVVRTLAGDPWGRLELLRERELDEVPRALAWMDLLRADYLAAAGRALLDSTTEHASSRVQFGRPIGEFQAVAHPLADASMRLDAARDLARIAASCFDAGDADLRASAAAARISAARAALEAVYACHQIFGAVGVTLKGPVFRFSRRIRQLVSLPPGEDVARALVLDPWGLRQTV